MAEESLLECTWTTRQLPCLVGMGSPNRADPLLRITPLHLRTSHGNFHLSRLEQVRVIIEAVHKARYGCVLLLILIAGCRPVVKPVEITESGWVNGCSDQSDATSSAHGLPFMLFQTQILGHFDTFTFSSNGIPKCETWRKWDVDELANAQARRDYEITVIQHTNWRGGWDVGFD
jgi:hypothetical protein